MSVRKDVYNSIASELEALGKFNLVDLYKGQFDEENITNIPRYPAAFISINNIEYQDMSMDIQEGNLIVDVYVFFDRNDEISLEEPNRENSLEILTVLDDVVNALQKTYGEFFTSLSQITDQDLTPTYKNPSFKISFSSMVFKRLEMADYILA